MQRYHWGIGLLIGLMLVLGVIAPSAHAAVRPSAITSVAQGTCGWQEGWVVTFDTDEQVLVGYTAFDLDDDPFVGDVASFWRAYWSTDFPFYHSPGFTQTRPDGSATERIAFSSC